MWRNTQKKKEMENEMENRMFSFSPPPPVNNYFSPSSVSFRLLCDVVYCGHKTRRKKPNEKPIKQISKQKSHTATAIATTTTPTTQLGKMLMKIV